MKDARMNRTRPDDLLYVPGGHAALGAYTEELAERYWQWDQDPAVAVGIGRRTLPSPQERADGTRQQAMMTLDTLRFTVYDMTGCTPAPVGWAGVEVDWRLLNGFMFIALGEPGARGWGLGTEAVRLVLDYAFHVSNLRNVWLRVYSPNEAAQRAYEKAGFRRIGVQRGAGMWLGQRVDQVLMDAVPEDFTGPSAVRQRVTGHHMDRR